VTRTNATESLVIAGYIRGVTTRDAEAALGQALGESAKVSRSTVNRMCEAIEGEFEVLRPTFRRSGDRFRVNYVPVIRDSAVSAEQVERARHAPRSRWRVPQAR